MKKRDPNLVFVGMPTRSGAMSEPTRVLFELFNEPIGPWKFIKPWKIGGTSIGRARNMLTQMALDSEASKMLQIDSDIVGGEQQVLRILSHEQPFVAGIYPRHELRWPTRWVVNWSGELRPDGLRAALDIGAGFFRADLDAVEAMVKAHPDLRHLSDEEFGKRAETFDLWSERVVTEAWDEGAPPWPRKLSEDFHFCWAARRAGFKVYGDTVCQLGHIGSVDYLQLACFIQQALAVKNPRLK